MQTVSDLSAATVRILLELGIPAHRVGYRQLCVAIPYYAGHDGLLLSKDLYPYVAHVLGYTDWRAVEHSIRDAILSAWKHREPAVWAQYFPGCRKAPSNKHFIATLAAVMTV